MLLLVLLEIPAHFRSVVGYLPMAMNVAERITPFL